MTLYSNTTMYFLVIFFLILWIVLSIFAITMIYKTEKNNSLNFGLWVVIILLFPIAGSLIGIIYYKKKK
ncbi:MAG: hypothetical protein LBV69_06830 [Bacteroidales bacterium]|jgi:hypothetical protein|nr:hypothetical protein [Bacteroidales bacterium]